MSENPPFHIEVVQAEHEHWRWVCSCGSKGARYCFRESVEGLAKTHMRQKHGIPPSRNERLRSLHSEWQPIYSIMPMAPWPCVECKKPWPCPTIQILDEV